MCFPLEKQENYCVAACFALSSVFEYICYLLAPGSSFPLGNQHQFTKHFQCLSSFCTAYGYRLACELPFLEICIFASVILKNRRLGWIFIAKSAHTVGLCRRGKHVQFSRLPSKRLLRQNREIQWKIFTIKIKIMKTQYIE